MRTPNDLRYTQSHEWVRFLSESTARMGITDYAQTKMGDIVFVNLPVEGDEAVVGAALTDIESVKAVADVISPLGGVVTAVNQRLEGEPEFINAEPYEAWIAEIGEINDRAELMDAESYRQFCQAEGD